MQSRMHLKASVSAFVGTGGEARFQPHLRATGQAGAKPLPALFVRPIAPGARMCYTERKNDREGQRMKLTSAGANKMIKAWNEDLEGLLKKEENNLALTEWGMDVSNFVLSEFLLG